MALAGAAVSARAQDPPVVELPFVVHAGVTDGSGGATLPDAIFRSEWGYGRVGAVPAGLGGERVLGAAPGWRAAWWEPIEKYLIRVPRGDLLVEISFLETDVAHGGLRAFDVLAEDRELFPKVDIAARAGDFQWLTLRGVVTVLDGWLDLRFVTAEGACAPRASRIRVEPAPPRGSDVPGPIRLEAHPGPGRVVLRWSAPASGRAASYVVLRAETRDGPFEPITREPWYLTSHEDLSAAAAGERFYRVAAIGLGGEQGPASEPVAAAARPASDAGLQVYDIRIPDEELRGISVRGADASALGELRLLGAMEPVRVRFDGRPGRWGRKKGIIIGPAEETARRIIDRRVIHLSPEARDPTLLREALSAEAARAAGVASPRVTPVAVVLNGRYLGVHFDIEALDGSFRRRAGLDRVGLLAEWTRGDAFEADWVPYGEERGEEGNILHLTDLVHELNRLGSGETARFFEDRFYLQKFIDREALAIVRGEPDRRAALRYWLRDSRNGKWELFQSEHGSGCWGILDDGAGFAAMDPSRARQLIISSSQRWPSVLDARLFSEPALVERLLRRVEAMLDRELAPAAVETMARSLFERIRKAALDDADLDPAALETLLAGPERIAADQARRAAALRTAIAAERARTPGELVIEEVMLVPADGDPWVELRNASGAPLDLSGWSLVADWRLGPVDAPGQAWLPLRVESFEPGARGIFYLTQSHPPGASGGIIELIAPSRDRSSPRQIVFLGRQTRGISYGLPPSADGSPGAAPRWAHLAKPTPGFPNEGPALPPLSYDFRHGVAPNPEAGTTIWWRTRPPADGESRPEKVLLVSRASGASGERETRELAWDDKAFRWSVTLPLEPEPRRTEYHFVAVSPEGIERSYPLPAPEVEYALPVLPRLKINEVLPRPAEAPGSPGEFVEIFNPSDQAIDLEGYFLTDTRRNPTKWRIPRGNEIRPGGFAVFYADGLGRGNHTSFKLSNSGEFIGLFGRMEEGNLPIDGIAYRGMRTGESWGASPDGSKSYRAWKDPTPGARNIPKIPKEVLEKSRREAAEAGEANVGEERKGE